MKHPHSRSKGFTLIELLVATVLFGFIVSLSMGIFFRALRNQRIVLALMATNDNAQSALEQMAREMRTSTSVAVGAAGATSIDLVNSSGKAVMYRLNATNETIEREVDGSALAITGSNVKVKRLAFFVSGGTLTEPIPRVTISLEVVPALKSVEALSTNIQMTISPR